MSSSGFSQPKNRDEKESFVLIDIYDKLKNSKVEDSLKSEGVCVCRVPKSLSSGNPDAFIPQFVGLGPYHHTKYLGLTVTRNRKRLTMTDELKLAIVKIVLPKHIPDDKQIFDQHLTNSFTDVGAFFHADVISSYDKKPVTLQYVLAVDALFLLALLSATNHTNFNFLTKERGLPLVNAVGLELTMDAIIRDVFMLENQIPTPFLTKATQLITPGKLPPDHLASTMKSFCQKHSPFDNLQDLPNPQDYLHLLDLMYHFIVSPPKPVKKDENHAEDSTGDSSATKPNGDPSATENAGDASASTAAGEGSATEPNGDPSATKNAGDASATENTGDASATENAGHASASTGAEEGSAPVSAGEGSASASGGDGSVASNLKKKITCFSVCFSILIVLVAIIVIVVLIIKLILKVLKLLYELLKELPVSVGGAVDGLHKYVTDNQDKWGFKHIAPLVIALKDLCDQFRSNGKDDRPVVTIPSVVELHGAGIHFEPATDNSFIRYDKDTCRLYLRSIKVDANTDVIIRNLVAYESLKFDTLVFTRYIEIMRAIIDIPEDVELLVQKNIIKTDLSNQVVADLFNGMSKSIKLTNTPDLEEEIKRVNDKFDKSQKTKRILTKYVYSVGKFFTLASALVVFFITAMHTYCSFSNCSSVSRLSNLPPAGDYEYNRNNYFISSM